MKLIRGLLSGAGISPKNLRYDPTSDQVQQTYDDGATWVDQPGQDPRHSTIYQFPPIGGSDPQCQAAANMSRGISDFLHNISGIASAATNAESMLTIIIGGLAVFFPEGAAVGVLAFLALDLASTIFSSTFAAVDAAFTSTVYDQLTCIFFCDISADGTVTADQLSTILSDINTQIGGLVYTVLSGMFFLMGEVGLSNMGAKGSAPADCSGCGCTWRYRWTFDASDGGWVTCYYGDFGGRCSTYTPGNGWRSIYSGYSNAYGFVYFLDVHSPVFDLPSGSAITQCIAQYTQNGNSDGGFIAIGAGTSLTDFEASDPLYTSNRWLAQQSTVGVPREGPISGMYAWNDNNWVDQDVYLQWYEIRGTGDPPPAFTGGAFV